MRFVLAPALTLLIAPGALAGETAWQQVAPQVSMRLIGTGDVGADGRTLVGLEIDMPQDTRTYWRVPGETGIPTRIDISASRGVAGHEILWPYPIIDNANGYLDYVYYGPTVLPVELTLEGGAADLNLSAVLGVCSDICVPVQASFSMPLGGEKPDAGNGLRLRQALALTPADWSDRIPPFGAVRYDAQAHALSVEVTADGVDTSSLIGAFEDGTPLLGAPEPDATGKWVRLPVLDESHGKPLAGRPLSLVFQTGMGAFGVTRTITAD